MAINFSLAQPNGDYLDTLKAFAIGRASRQQEQQQSGRKRASEQVAAGDLSGARATAIAEGDFDLSAAIGKMGEDQRKQAAEAAQIMGATAFGIKNVPVEQREQAFRQAVPALQGRYSTEQLQQAYQALSQAGWSDQALDGYINSAMTAEDALSAYTKQNEQYTLAPGSARYDAAGNIIAEQPFAPQYREVGPGQELVEIPGANPRGGGPASGGGGRAVALDGNNPGGINDGEFARSQPGYAGANGRYAAFDTIENGFAAQKALLGSYVQRGFDTPAKIAARWAPAGDGANDPNAYARFVAGKMGIGVNDRISPAQIDRFAMAAAEQENSDAPRVIARGSPKQKDAPSGYRWAADGQSLEPIPGGPGAGRPGGDRKAEADLRKEFNQRPEVKAFADVRQSMNNIRQYYLGQTQGTPTPQRDMSMIFSFMKMLDPGSVVREGEFASAQNAAGVEDRIRNLYNRARNGTLMNPRQRADMLNAAQDTFFSQQGNYNRVADEYRTYARDYEINPDRVAPRSVSKGRRRRGGGGGQAPQTPQGWTITRVN